MKIDDVKSGIKKKLVTFSLDININEKFNILSKKLKINKSLLVEKSILNFLKECEEI